MTTKAIDVLSRRLDAITRTADEIDAPRDVRDLAHALQECADCLRRICDNPRGAFFMSQNCERARQHLATLDQITGKIERAR